MSSPSDGGERKLGIDLSGSLQGAGGVGGLLLAEVSDGSSTIARHFHYDGNGNVTEVTDLAGNNLARYRYDAFGNTLVATGTHATANKYRFSTKPLDNEIPNAQLYYYGYRYYDPLTGRWPSRDPIEEEGGLNLYGFVGNDGINLSDFLGLAEIITDMTNGKTYWIPTNCCCEGPTEYDSLNEVASRARPGANDPYSSEDSRPGRTPAMRGNPTAYGPNDGILTNDPRGRWIHGGGSSLGREGSQAPRQELCPTMGCTRMHNEDVEELADRLRDERRKNPGEPVPYTRDHFPEGGEPEAVDNCRAMYYSQPCRQARSRDNPDCPSCEDVFNEMNGH